MADSYIDSLSESDSNNSNDTLRTLIKHIKNTSSESFWPFEEGWRQYIKDHYNEIKEKAITIAVDPNDARKYCYSVEAYLIEQNVPRSVSWIVMWLNQLDSSMHFDKDIQSMLIPDMDQLKQYRMQYSTIRVQRNKALQTYDL